MLGIIEEMVINIYTPYPESAEKSSTFAYQGTNPVEMKS